MKNLIIEQQASDYFDKMKANKFVFQCKANSVRICAVKMYDAYQLESFKPKSPRNDAHTRHFFMVILEKQPSL